MTLDYMGVGLEREIEAMRRLALGYDGMDDPGVEGTARHIVSVEPTKESHFKAIEGWVLERVGYVPDPCSEMIKSPEQMIKEIIHHGRCSGDGPDIAVLVAALCLSLGMEVQYVAVGFHGRPISHVFARAKLPEAAWNPNPAAGKSFAELVTESIVFPVEVGP